MLIIILCPLVFLLIAEIGPPNRRLPRTGGSWWMYLCIVLCVLLDLATLLPRRQVDGGAVANARQDLAVAQLNVVLSSMAAMLGAVSFGIFLFKARRPRRAAG